MIPLPASELRTLLKANPDWPQGRLIGGQPFWTLEEVNALRGCLHLADLTETSFPNLHY